MMIGVITINFDMVYFTVTRQMQGERPTVLYHGTDGAEAMRIFNQASGRG
jgi:hypothetical protein